MVGMTPWGVFFLAFYNVLLVNGGTLSTESTWDRLTENKTRVLPHTVLDFPHDYRDPGGQTRSRPGEGRLADFCGTQKSGLDGGWPVGYPPHGGKFRRSY